MRPVLLLSLLVALAPAASASDPVDWEALYRPLHLPSLGTGGRCPISRIDREITPEGYGIGSARGRGPVYAVLGEPGVLQIHYRPEEWGRGPWGGQKVLWFVHRRYSGPVLIRGRRIGGWQWMRFDRGPGPPAEIRIEPGETVLWSGQPPGSRGRPSYVRARAPGCYAAQVDGTDFSYAIVFRIEGPT